MIVNFSELNELGLHFYVQEMSELIRAFAAWHS